MTPAALALLAVLGGQADRAAADQNELSWLRIERMDVGPSVLEDYAQVRFYATAVNLRGQIIDISGKDAWALTIGSKKKRIPFIAGQFHALEDELALAIVVDTSAEFADVLPLLQQQLVAFVERLPKKRTQIAVIGFDERVHGTGRVRPARYAAGEIQRLYANSDPGDKLLLDAVSRARRGVARAEPENEGANLRRMILVISDGRDAEYPNPVNYRKISSRAGRDGIPIHTIGYAPDGNRLPLRGLGELSKNSAGTFRFAYSKGGFEGHFAQLTNEILNQYVVTFLVPADEIKAKKIGLVAYSKNLDSTEQLRVGKLTCDGKDECEGGYCVGSSCVARSLDSGRGVLGWLLLVGGIILGAIVLFIIATVVVAMLVRRRAARAHARELPPDNQLPAGEAEPPDAHRVVAHGPYGGAIQPSQPRGRMPSAAGHEQMPPTGAQRVLPTGAHGAAGQQRVVPTGAHGAAVPPGYAATRPPPSLLILQGPYQGQRIPLHNGFLIGKAPGCHLMLAGDNYASGHHARIEMDARGTCTLYDQGSTNGTFVNRVRVTQKLLSHGHVITIGSTEARFLAQ